MKDLQRPCPVCGGARGEVLHHQNFAVTDDYPLPDHYDLVICATCGMVFADSPATQADYDKYYATCSIYEQPSGTATGATPSSDSPRLEHGGALFASHIPSKAARILDVGCANGGMLQVMSRHGFHNLAGLDPSPACAENIRRAGFQAYCGDTDHLPEGMGVFDAVFLTAVLEHVLDIRSAIGAMVSLCSDHGRIFLEVPDAAGYFLNAPFQDINTEHINHFSIASLRNLMGQFGFAPVFEDRSSVAGPSGTMIAVLVAAYERVADLAPRLASGPWIIDEQFRGHLQRYIDGSTVMMQGIDRQLRKVLASSPEVIIWGTGQLTMKLLCDTALKDVRIAAFVDGNPVNVGKTLHGIIIQRPEKLKSGTVPIIIATLLHTEGIRNRIASLGLKNPVVTLQSN